jgi:hydroxyacylglutathione hydrolase
MKRDPEKHPWSEPAKRKLNRSLVVHQFPCLQDNYGYLVHCKLSDYTACIDTPDVAAIEQALEEKGWTLSHILNTHHHPDHAGGNLELKEKTGCKIVGPAHDAARIPGIDILVDEAHPFRFGTNEVEVLNTPGHTTGHIVYRFRTHNMAFVGDTLFSMGCGRLFEGTPEQMWNSLQKIMQWPDHTLLYCAHEYTQNNARFALTVEPDNLELQSRAMRVNELRSAGEPTVPTSLKIEKLTNPFLRPDSEGIRRQLNMPQAADVAVFAEIRARKDAF